MDSSAPNSGMDRMDGFAKKAFGAVSGVASSACGYAKQLPSSHINGMDLCGKAFGAVSGLGVNATTVGAVATVGVAAWGVYMLVGSPGKKMMMKNPGRPWELIDAVEFRNNPIFRKAIFDRTHLFKARL
nr:cytochrome P450 CYP749A22-like [Ipomoea batatas]